MLEGFRRAGFARGQTILDVGAGPGFATADLADWSGRMAASSRSSGRRISPPTLGHAASPTSRCARQDVNEQDFGTDIADGAWTRWVLAFVADPARTVRHIAQALKPGASRVFHEYADYQVVAHHAAVARPRAVPRR